MIQESFLYYAVTNVRKETPMGPLIKYTNRLILRVENESKAKQVLDLYLRNRLPFEQYEPTRPSSFYTQDYHRSSLHREYIAYSLGTFLRYYIYLKNRPDKIIGAVNFNIFHTAQEPYAEIGYKIDALYQNRGIAYEACEAALYVLEHDYKIFRVDARIHPENIASVTLATKLGFRPLQFEPQSANILGHYVDLMRYTKHL